MSNEQEYRSAKKPRSSNPLRKIEKAAAKLADHITAADTAEAARVIRQALNANHHVYDTDSKRLIPHPDHKTRLAAASLLIGHVEGLPVRRSIELRTDFKSADEIIERLRSSPEALRAIMGGSVQVGSKNLAIEGLTFTPANSE